MLADSDETSDMRHVDHQISSDFIRDFAEFRKVDFAWVCTCTRNDQLRLMLKRFLTDIFVVDTLVLFADTILDEIVQLPGKVPRAAVRQVPAVGKVHAENRV